MIIGQQARERIEESPHKDRSTRTCVRVCVCVCREREKRIKVQCWIPVKRIKTTVARF